MRTFSKGILLLFTLAGPSYGFDTQTPLVAGTHVEVSAGGTSFHGDIQDSSFPGWIKIAPNDVTAIYFPLASVDYVKPSFSGDVTEIECQGPAWVLRSKHLKYGAPRLVDHRWDFTPSGETGAVPGISVLVREGFVVGHLDKHKVPLWVAMHWTDDDHAESAAQPSFPRPFEPDSELPSYAQAGTNYNHSQTQMDRGHMARHKDNAAWGRDNSDAGCFMSNIAPQHKNLNRFTWLELENAHRDKVAEENGSIQTLWVISGTIFEGEPEEVNGIGIPAATYKVIGWEDDDGSFHTRGFVLKQTDSSGDPEDFLTPVDEIEEATGLDFWPELPDAVENIIEAAEYSELWEDQTVL